MLHSQQSCLVRLNWALECFTSLCGLFHLVWTQSETSGVNQRPGLWSTSKQWNWISCRWANYLWWEAHPHQSSSTIYVSKSKCQAARKVRSGFIYTWKYATHCSKAWALLEWKKRIIGITTSAMFFTLEIRPVISLFSCLTMWPIIVQNSVHVTFVYYFMVHFRFVFVNMNQLKQNIGPFGTHRGGQLLGVT